MKTLIVSGGNVGKEILNKSAGVMKNNGKDVNYAR